MYNASSDTLLLQNYYLSDDKNNIQQWQLPNISLYPDSYFLVFASGKNLYAPEYHSNFKLKSTGEQVFLSKTYIIDSLTIPFLKADFSFGRLNEQTNNWSILDVSSPLQSNAFSNHLEFSHASGFYDESFHLQINSIKPNQTIHYTLIDENLTSFLINRPCVVQNQINDFFDLKIEDLNCKHKIQDELEFKIFPNPNKGVFSIISDSKFVLGSLNVLVYNSQGKLLVSNKVYLQEENHFIFRRKYDFPKGIYFVKMISSDLHYGIQKFIIN